MVNLKIAAITALATLTVAFAAAPVCAEPVTVTATRPNADVPVRIVSFRDLNLASAEGERTLTGRVRGATKGVCFDGGYTLSDHGYDQCVHQAWNSASPQMTAAVQRARDIAMTGHSIIPLSATAIAIHAN